MYTVANLEFATAVSFYAAAASGEHAPTIDDRGTRLSILGPPSVDSSIDILEHPEMLWVNVPWDSNRAEVQHAKTTLCTSSCQLFCRKQSCSFNRLKGLRSLAIGQIDTKTEQICTGTTFTSEIRQISTKTGTSLVSRCVHSQINTKYRTY